MTTEELLARVLRLPRSERARLAEEVLASLEEPDDQVAAAWARELERRSREIAEGRVQPADWDAAGVEIMREIARTLDGVEAGRPGNRTAIDERAALFSEADNKG